MATLEAPGPDGTPVTWPMIVGAADRMVTVEGGPIEFESPEPKVYRLTTYCAAMISGDSAIQAVLLRRTLKVVDERYEKINVVPIEDIAQIYADEFARYRRELAERRYLTPRGLTVESFLEKQKAMNPDLATTLDHRLEHAEIDPETIVAGLDAEGAHIFVVSDPGEVTCMDREGFAAVGIGASHAESQFMFARYCRQTPIGSAMMLTYSVKKHAEPAAPGGRETDIVFVGPFNGVEMASEAEKDGLDQIYNATREKIDAVNREAARRSQEYLEGVLKAGAQKAAEGGNHIPHFCRGTES